MIDEATPRVETAAPEPNGMMLEPIKIGELVGRLSADLRDYYTGNAFTESHRCRKAAESLVDIVRVLEAQQNEINELRKAIKAIGGK